MLKNIKSSYFIKILFSYIRDEIKLKLIQYNKNFQKIAEINVVNYKFLSGKYIIYEKCGKIKEFCGYNDNLIFEGEYSNCKEIGKEKNIMK